LNYVSPRSQTMPFFTKIYYKKSCLYYREKMKNIWFHQTTIVIKNIDFFTHHSAVIWTLCKKTSKIDHFDDVRYMFFEKMEQIWALFEGYYTEKTFLSPKSNLVAKNRKNMFFSIFFHFRKFGTFFTIVVR